MLKGVNIDISNNPPDPALLARWGIDAVRFPSRPGMDIYIDDLTEYGIFTLAVVDKPAAGYICGGGLCSAYQIHNEVDGGGGAASGVLNLEECNDELRIYREQYPDLVLVAPGLVAGDYSAAYLKGIVQTLRDYRYAAIALHPYAKSGGAATKLLQAHQTVAPRFPVLYTECHPDANDLRAFYKSAASAGCSGVFYHCYNDDMTAGSEGINLGLVGLDGAHKPELGFWIFS